jgi:phage/plasmid-like protein (TIGR03299 family)
VITLADRRSAWGSTREPESYASAAEMLEAAGLNGWNVQKRLVYADSGPHGMLGVPNRWATVRMDTGRPLGVVRGAYTIIQNEDAFAFGDMVLDQPGRNWERAGDFKGGEVVFGALRLGDLAFAMPADPDGQVPYLLIVNSHGGSTNYEALITWVRVRCWNTFQMARHGYHSRFRLRHTGDLHGKVQAAREALGITFKHIEEEVKPLAHAMANAKIVDAQVREIFESTIWPITENAQQDGPKSSHPSQQAFAVYMNSETLEGVRGTAWGAFQAVTEYLDHQEGQFARRVERHTPEQQRSYVLMFGTGADKKQQALDALAAFTKK